VAHPVNHVVPHHDDTAFRDLRVLFRGDGFEDSPESWKTPFGFGRDQHAQTRT
jgi:hypothetical protein